MFKLSSQSIYGGLNKSLTHFEIGEISNFEIVSLAIENGKAANCDKIFKKSFGTSLPAPGHWQSTKSGKVLWTAQNQYFLFIDDEDERADETVSNSLNQLAYTTLQTDGWAALSLRGEQVHNVLERFIALDLRNWKPGQGARTTAHHMSVFVMKNDQLDYWLLTPRSSSTTFIEALTHTAENVL